MTPAPATRRSPARALLWPLLAALPVALLALVGAWALCRFLAVRDHLGRWTVTMRDDHGTVLGQGPVVLTADAWTLRWSAAWPWLDVDARMTSTPLPLTPAGRDMLGVPTTWCTATLPWTPAGPDHGAIVFPVDRDQVSGLVVVAWRTRTGEARFAFANHAYLTFPVELAR
jgi:hypothetical protein